MPRFSGVRRGAQLTLVTVCVLPLAGAAGCGDDRDTPTGFAVATQATTRQVLTEDGTLSPTRQRQIIFHVRPRCRGELDCRGTYTLYAKYRFRPGRPDSIRCLDLQPGLGFSKAGLVDASVTGEPQALNCFDDSDAGRVTIDGSLRLASSDDPSKKAFGVTMGVTGDLTDRLGYRWSGRDGAHCSGTFSAKTNAVQRFTCPGR